MDKSADHAQPQSDAPDTDFNILLARGEYEEAKIGEIKDALDRGDKDRVFALAKELIYGGPGTQQD
jgi:hypothetical protein